MIPSSIKLLDRCYRLALPYGHLKLFSVLGLILFNGLLQLVGVTSVFPFFALAANPGQIRQSKVGSALISLLPPMSDEMLLVWAGVFAISMLFLASVGSLLSEYVRVRYAHGFSHWLRGRMLGDYSARPYSYFLERNSSQLSQNLLDIQIFTQNVLLPIGEMLTRLVLVVLLVSSIFLIQHKIAILAGILFGGYYVLALMIVRPKTKEVGANLEYSHVRLLKNVNQFLQGIKTMMVQEKGGVFIGKALEHSAQIGKYQAKIPIYSNAPRYLIEPLAFGGLVAVVVVMALHGSSLKEILPHLSVIAFAGIKLIPALQLLYGQVVLASSNLYTLTQIENEIISIEKKPVVTKKPGIVGAVSPLSFKSEIAIDRITFRYPQAPSPVIRDFSLTIQKNESVGIAGASGSGKSTLVDLVLGLHEPQEGVIRVDGEPITPRNVNSWRAIIGYVPQEIFLIDDTLEANIAFGIPSKEIDRLKLNQAASGAQILEYIKSLPEDFKTTVGERGVRLSGGQRQRIGLARALYHNPSVLILDEATSALDNETEKAVMETINRFHGKLTIITIAHRLSTLEQCDRIVELGAPDQSGIDHHALEIKSPSSDAQTDRLAFYQRGENELEKPLLGKGDSSVMGKLRKHIIKLFLNLPWRLRYRRRVPLFWYDSPNWGDALNPYLLKCLSGRNAVLVERTFANRFFAIGSILSAANRHSEIWGSGFIKEGDSLTEAPRKIHAVRGPLTRIALLEMGVPCPEIYGDPALLLPRFYNPQVKKEHKEGVIPHYTEKDHPWVNALRSQGVFVIDVESGIEEFVQQVKSCHTILSSSLHGLICADAYGIPNVWIKISDRVIGGDFKFRDYRLSIGAPDPVPVIIEEDQPLDALCAKAVQYEIKLDLDRLLNACPFFEDRNRVQS